MYLELLVNDVLNTIKPTISIREAISHQRRAGEEGEGEEGRNHHQLEEGEGEGEREGERGFERHRSVTKIDGQM